VKHDDKYICLSICPLAYLENHAANLHRIFVHVACGRGSVLLRWRCNMLCTSGFVDDVMFLADRTIGRAYGTVSRLSVVCLSVVCL